MWHSLSLTIVQIREVLLLQYKTKIQRLIKTSIKHQISLLNKTQGAGRKVAL